MIDATAVVPLLTDWTNGGYSNLKAKDVKRAKVYTSEYREDTPDNRRNLAADLGLRNLPAVVLDYDQFRETKGRAAVLYTLTGDDYNEYLRHAEECDRATT